MPERTLRRCYCDEMISCNSTLCGLLRAAETAQAEGSSFFHPVATVATTNVHVPIVFHVLGKPSVQNSITNEQIESQVAQLNADFLASNLDIVNVPSTFTSRLAYKDGRISFSIADIVRTQTNVEVYSMGFGPLGWNTCNQTMKYAALGGVNAVDRANKLNVWICDFSTDGALPFDVLGYSWFPEWLADGGCSESADGIVMLPGTIGSTIMPGFYEPAGYGKGRTLSHEVGHYLSLRHIWNDCQPSLCCGVLDLPGQRGPNFGKPIHPHRAGSCFDANGQISPGDMFMNYMDYADDDVLIAFSVGQMNSMVQSALSYRPGLVVSGSGPGPSPAPLAAPVVQNLVVGDASSSPDLEIDVRVLGTATFNNASNFTGRLVGNAVFNGTSTNNGVIFGSASFNDGSSNLGTVTGTVVCNTTGTCV